jgi:hypothetical protein
MSLTVWDGDEGPRQEPPSWLLTGHMLLWNDGSPAHVDMQPFKATDDGGWQANVMISRSALQGTRWLTMRMRLTPEVRTEWEAGGKSARLRALQVLANYLRLTEWYEDDLGVLDLK